MSDILPATAILEIEMEEPKIMQIGSYSPSSAYNAKVLDTDGLCPTLLDHKGAEPAIIEPLSCAMRGRNPENPSDRTAGINTEQLLEIGSDVANCVTTVQKDSMVIEPVILTPIRTEKAKELRRQGIETFANRELVPRTDGCSGTITTVHKDNLLQEPIKIRQATAQGYIECPAGGGFDAAYPNSKLRRGRVQQNGDVVGAITASADNHCVYEGVSILGYTRDDKGNMQSYHEKDVAGTIHTSSGSGGNTDQFVRTRYRIRKLTPTECFRLQGVDDSDIDKLKSAKFTQTLKSGKVKEKPMPKTQLYKMAGNSIVVDVLYHIFHQMFIAEPPQPKPIQKSLFDI